jgi:hypothetical protein
MATRCKFPALPIPAIPSFTFPPPLPALPIPKIPSFKCILDEVLGPPPEK